MSECLPYNGEEYELRDDIEDIFNTNNTQMDLQDVLKSVFNHTQLVTDHDIVDRIDQVKYKTYPVILYHINELACLRSIPNILPIQYI